MNKGIEKKDTHRAREDISIENNEEHCKPLQEQNTDSELKNTTI